MRVGARLLSTQLGIALLPRRGWLQAGAALLGDKG
jgi:hypothetical protein